MIENEIQIKTTKVSPTEPRKIEKPKQLLIEDARAIEAFSKLLKNYNISDVQIQPFGGKSRLNDYLRLLSNLPDFEIVKSIGIIRDADENADSAFDSVCSAIINAGLQKPKEPLVKSTGKVTVSVYLCPDGKECTGALEDLFLQSIKESDIYKKCIVDFLDCAKNNNEKVSSKAPAYAYIAVKDSPDVSFGISVQRGYWNLEHPCFNTLKKFLNRL